MWGVLLQRVLGMIGPAVGRAAPAVQQNAAQAIAKLTGQNVAANAKSIGNAIQVYAANNPTKMAIATNVLAGVGVSVSVDKMMEVFQSEGVQSEVIDMVGAEVSESLRQQRAGFTGDGKVDTVHGASRDDRLQLIREQRVINAKIETAARALGVSVESLVAIREVMFLEDADFVLYSEGV